MKVKLFFLFLLLLATLSYSDTACTSDAPCFKPCIVEFGVMNDIVACYGDE